MPSLLHMRDPFGDINVERLLPSIGATSFSISFSISHLTHACVARTDGENLSLAPDAAEAAFDNPFSAAFPTTHTHTNNKVEAFAIFPRRLPTMAKLRELYVNHTTVYLFFPFYQVLMSTWKGCLQCCGRLLRGVAGMLGACVPI